MLRTYVYIVLALVLALGFFVGATVAKVTRPEIPSDATPVLSNGMTTRAVAVLVDNGEKTRNWTGIELREGDSVAMLLDRIAHVEGINLVWNGEGRERTLGSWDNAGNAQGTWQYFVNGATPTMPIAKYYPKPGDVITVTYNLNH